ncbi:MAG: type I-MYXAN CRISPR-associated protein Cas6/Cmx6, partial [Casimicrobiaceae bacterium]
PWATLHAQRVALDVVDEVAFGDEIIRRLATHDVRCEYMTGRRRVQRAGERDIEGYSVVLHGLRPEQSLRVQCEGIGADRALGWGIFIPHKSIAAVA